MAGGSVLAGRERLGSDPGSTLTDRASTLTRRVMRMSRQGRNGTHREWSGPRPESTLKGNGYRQGIDLGQRAFGIRDIEPPASRVLDIRMCVSDVRQWQGIDLAGQAGRKGRRKKPAPTYGDPYRVCLNSQGQCNARELNGREWQGKGSSKGDGIDRQSKRPSTVQCNAYTPRVISRQFTCKRRSNARDDVKGKGGGKERKRSGRKQRRQKSSMGSECLS
jgi:hypothetical protein